MCWRELVQEDSVNIFVGDYFDPYEEIPFEELMQNFEEILALKRQRPETVLLYGNHDLHYLLQRDRASRFDHAHALEIRQAFADASDLFHGVAYTIGDEILVTHAGVSKEWYEKEFGAYEGTPVAEVADDINDLWAHNKMEFTFDVNASQFLDMSGESPTHSPLWIRPWTLADHNLFAGTTYKQVFGHTQVDNTIVIDDCLICVDCLGTIVKSYKLSV
jgi:UDP-2,3-diacylglucosamine pyrophosphatase LpxH